MTLFIDHLNASTFGYEANNSEAEIRTRVIVEIKRTQNGKLEIGSQKCSDRYDNATHAQFW